MGDRAHRRILGRRWSRRAAPSLPLEKPAGPQLAHPQERPAVEAFGTRRSLLVPSECAASRRQVARNASDCGSLTALPLRAPISATQASAEAARQSPYSREGPARTWRWWVRNRRAHRRRLLQGAQCSDALRVRCGRTSSRAGAPQWPTGGTADSTDRVLGQKFGEVASRRETDRAVRSQTGPRRAEEAAPSLGSRQPVARLNSDSR